MFFLRFVLLLGIIFAIGEKPSLAFEIGQKDDVVVFQRSACFGTCPVYTISVFANGDFVFEGLAHVRFQGIYRGRFDADIFPRLLAALDAAHYNEFNDHYVYGEDDGCKEYLTDHPSVRILVQRSGSIKEIWHYRGCRGFAREAELVALEDKLQEIVGSNLGNF